MSLTISSDRIDLIVRNQHQNPFEVLGPHQVELDGQKVWVVRVYQPNASKVTLLLPEERQEYPMTAEHHPNFFECTLPVKELNNYQLKVIEGDQERVIYDPYAFPSPVLTEFDIHLFAEGNHQHIYEKIDRKSTRLNSSHRNTSRMPSSA